LIVEGDAEHGQPIGTEVSVDRVNELFDKDVSKFVEETKKVFPDLEDKPEEVQQVAVNMCFNLGEPRLSKFKKFIAAINEENWETAAAEMLDSRWAQQVGERAVRLSKRILSLAE
jgi:lysozyme